MTPTSTLPNHVRQLLRERFGHQDFRPGQAAIIDALLQGQNVLTVMPTGSGKSLCYQLPALLNEGCTLVISPLIALMKDQVDSLQDQGIAATFINSSLSAQEQQERLYACRAGHYKLLYIAPERFRSPRFLHAIEHTRVSLFAVDEAHCISQWGHDFRPDYLRLQQAVEQLNHPQVLALTATATVEVQDDIVRQLESEWHDVPRRMLEAIAVEGYCSGTLSRGQVRRMLNLSWHETETFLKARQVYLHYDENDLEHDVATLDRLLPK